MKILDSSNEDESINAISPLEIFKIMMVRNIFICKQLVLFISVYRCPKKVGTLKYLEKYKFYRKMFQTKVICLILQITVRAFADVIAQN